MFPDRQSYAAHILAKRHKKTFRVIRVFRGLSISIFHLPSSILYAAVVHFRKITIIGVGLLGGSLGLAVRRRKLARLTAGFVRRTASLKDCERTGAVDFATTDLLAAVGMPTSSFCALRCRKCVHASGKCSRP